MKVPREMFRGCWKRWVFGSMCLRATGGDVVLYPCFLLKLHGPLIFFAVF